MNGNSATWEEQTLARLQSAKEERQFHAEQMVSHEAALKQCDQYIQALETVLTIDRQRRSIRLNGKVAVDPERLRTQSIREMLVEIAAKNNGLLVTKEALHLLIEAGIFRDSDEGRNALYSTLSRSKSYFAKERRGLYRLKRKAQLNLAAKMTVSS